jgi:hypothetical protein
MLRDSPVAWKPQVQLGWNFLPVKVPIIVPAWKWSAEKATLPDSSNRIRFRALW